MILGIQILGIFFGLTMVYFNYLYYKKKNYNFNNFMMWNFIWGIFIFIASFPTTTYSIMEVLKIERTVDFFIISGFMLFSIILFQLWNKTKKMEQRIQKLVRGIALQNDKKNN